MYLYRYELIETILVYSTHDNESWAIHNTHKYTHSSVISSLYSTRVLQNRNMNYFVQHTPFTGTDKDPLIFNISIYLMDSHRKEIFVLCNHSRNLEPFSYNSSENIPNIEQLITDSLFAMDLLGVINIYHLCQYFYIQKARV